MAARKKAEEAEIYQCIDPHVTVITDGDGTELELLYRRGDRLPGDHPAVKQAHIYWLPAMYTAVDEASHRRKYGLHGRH